VGPGEATGRFGRGGRPLSSRGCPFYTARSGTSPTAVRKLRSSCAAPVADDAEQIRALISEIAHATDSGDFDRWVELFVPDGRHVQAGTVHEGHEELRRHIDADQPPEHRGIHITSNSVMQIGGDTASSTTDFLFIAPTDMGLSVIAYGEYHDRFVRTDLGWRFLERAIVLGAEPATEGWPRARSAERRHEEDER
jgi:uncharacterized protein (TIGR02246 family)